MTTFGQLSTAVSAIAEHAGAVRSMPSTASVAQALDHVTALSQGLVDATQLIKPFLSFDPTATTAARLSEGIAAQVEALGPTLSVGARPAGDALDGAIAFTRTATTELASMVTSTRSAGEALARRGQAITTQKHAVLAQATAAQAEAVSTLEMFKLANPGIEVTPANVPAQVIAGAQKAQQLNASAAELQIAHTSIMADVTEFKRMTAELFDQSM